VATLAREVHADWWQARRAVSTTDPSEGGCGSPTAGRMHRRGAVPGPSTPRLGRASLLPE